MFIKSVNFSMSECELISDATLNPETKYRLNKKQKELKLSFQGLRSCSLRFLVIKKEVVMPEIMFKIHKMSRGGECLSELDTRR